MKLSIITINRNNAEGLEKTIKSVIDQTFTNFEYIIIDGNSTDNSTEIINKYESKINYWVSEPDTGIYNAMNKGIRQATGEYCLFLNSGDYLADDNTIATVFKHKRNEDIIYGNVNVERKEYTEISISPDVLTVSFFWKNTLGHSASFIKKELFSTIGLYNEEIQISSDHDFFQKAICVHNASYTHLPVVVSIITLDGLSSDPANHDKLEQEHRNSFKSNLPLCFMDYEIMNDYYLQICLKFYKEKSFQILLKLYRKMNKLFSF